MSRRELPVLGPTGDPGLKDADPDDPFDFFPDRMNDQLAAGYAKMRADGGLTMFVPDFEESR